MYSFNLQDSLFLPQRGCSINLSFAAGDLLVFAGENGLGKSRLLQRMREALGPHTFVEQTSPDHFYDRTIAQIKELMLTLPHGVNRLRFERMLDAFNLSQKEERKLSQLSGGEGQALKICLALAKDVPLIFLDEPSHFLDTARKEVLQQQLAKLRAEGKAIIMVEHDWSWLKSSAKIYRLAEKDGQLYVEQTWTT